MESFLQLRTIMNAIVIFDIFTIKLNNYLEVIVNGKRFKPIYQK